MKRENDKGQKTEKKPLSLTTVTIKLLTGVKAGMMGTRVCSSPCSH